MKKDFFLKFNLTTLVLFFTVLFTGCLKDDVPFESVPAPPDLITTINSSVSGFVTDENNVAVQGAFVKAGSKTTFTDKYGYFEITSASVVKDAALVTVTRTGYFKSIKTFVAVENKKAFFRIKMIPLNNAGTINAGTGGAVTLTNGLKVELPANSVVNAATNVAYAGTVSVAAYWIDPTGTDLPVIMPGDLRGINADGNVQLLTTYGMAAVQLTGAGGELLQIGPGKKANLTFPIPSAIAATAPATIPLWYMDEATGLWNQEGTATKSGSNYVGEVTHFSFWNCDVPDNYVQFSCTVVGSNGLPVPNALVKISLVSNPNSAGWGYTDAAGFVKGFVPDNAQLLLEVFNNYNCNTVLYSQNFTTTNANIPLGNITVNTANAMAVLTGTITNCVSTPVTDGYVMVTEGGYNYTYHVTNGTFNSNLLLCSGNSTVTIVAIDNANLQESASLTYSIHSGNNAIGNIQACGTSPQQFINYSINGAPYTYYSPVDTFFHTIGLLNLPGEYHSVTGERSFSNGDVSLSFLTAGIAQGSNQQLTQFYVTPYIDTFKIAAPVMVNITEYGASAGQFISGNFTGTFTGVSPANTSYSIVCNFRFQRRM